MPIYIYKCTNCNTVLEKLQKINDEPLKDCNICNMPSMKKQIGATNFQLKGTGWYKTDFK